MGGETEQRRQQAAPPQGDGEPSRAAAAEPIQAAAEPVADASPAEAEPPPAEAEPPPAEAEPPPAEAEPHDGDAAEIQGDLDELVAKAKQRDEYLALAQRTQADFENYRKRVAREQAAAGERAMASLVKELLPALDNLDRALEAAEAHDPLLAGVKLVHAELNAALARMGIEQFAPLGERFDPNEHEAMSQQPVEGVESGRVAEVFQNGYRLKGAVIRPARVLVAA
jgi:molecular chaperone GrpE